MKNYIRIFLIAVVLLPSGCKDWLDVTPAGQATESDLFSSGSGYRSVLNGLYKSMGSSALYGRNWSYGMLDCMAQLYDLDNSATFSDDMCRAAEKFEYTDARVSVAIEEAWGIAYNIIANANDLLQNIQNASADLFAEGEVEKNMIMGEAYACRALVHFELLRLFAPAPVSDDGRAYIPYI
ncbi:MAG: RagB/SusD family nutrient uptake outer membrane protein, partial [Butyricimonas faecihominis]